MVSGADDSTADGATTTADSAIRKRFVNEVESLSSFFGLDEAARLRISTKIANRDSSSEFDASRGRLDKLKRQHASSVALKS